MLRRKFLKGLAVVLSSALVAPSLIFDEQEFLPSTAVLADGWLKILKHKGFHQSEDGQLHMDFILNSSEVWNYIKIIDQDGRVWHSPDEGETWLPDGFYEVKGEILGTFSYSEA